MSENYKRIETKLVHAGEPVPRVEGAVVLPIFQSSSFDFTGEEPYDKIKYFRLNNTPNHIALNRKLAALENGEDALVTASGMAAISTSLLSALSAGDHLLIQESLYGGTHGLVTKDFAGFGVEYDFIDPDQPASWKAGLRKNTKAIYVETISNPLMKVPDLEGIVRFAKEHGLISMVDNTFASPINFRPPEHGFDLSLHSCTKYLNGHTDIVAGAVIGRADLVKEVAGKLKFLGGCLDTHACFLLHRGVRTLALRVRQQNENAMALAEFLESHPAVSAVNYPGLPSGKYYEPASELLDGFGGMLSFELKDSSIESARRLCGQLKLPIFAPSLGGIESLVTIPATSSHRGLSADELSKAGISAGLIRVSVGIEAKEDIIEDFGQALE